MRLTKFGTYTFPLYNKKDVISQGASGGALLDLPGGGAYDDYGSDTSPEDVVTLTTSFEIAAQTAVAVQTQRDLIRKLRGQYKRLYAVVPDGTTRFVWARLAKVKMERRLEYIYYQPVELGFEVSHPGWNGAGHGSPWEGDGGELLEGGIEIGEGTEVKPDATGYPYTVNNGGDRVQNEVLLTITAGTSSISNVEFHLGPSRWLWAGTVAIGKSLVIDTTTKTIKNNGVDAYTGFSFLTNNTTADWIRIQPGNNGGTLYFSGNATNDATFKFEFYDGWE